MRADSELKNACHSFSMESPTYVGCSMVDPSAACISKVVSANTDKITADDIVAATMNIINATTVV